jgi:hypothetical protein
MDDLQDFETLTHDIMRISERTQGRPTDWRGQHASLAFAKIGVTALTLLRLIPGSRYFGPAGAYAIWDLSAIASQCRNLMEAYYLLCYLVRETPDPAEREFRQAVWEYHEDYERHAMLQISLPQAKSLPAVAASLLEAKRRLEASAVFQTLSVGKRQELLDARRFKLESAIELSRQVGISEKYYRAQYKYCSAFAHSAPFSVSQLDQFRAGADSAKSVIGTLVALALAYCAVSIRDFLALFPEGRAGLPASSAELIAKWEGILKWEKSPWYNAAPGEPRG